MEADFEPISKIKLKLGIDVNGKVQTFATNCIANHMDKYIPKDTGLLRVIKTITPTTITYEMPYAHAQYVGKIKNKKIQNYTTPGTGPYWDKRMLSAEKDIIIEEITNYARSLK